jgi:outer membrane protein OmpA-like peptidoglycan-associated protein
MEALILAHQDASQAAMQALALERGVAVRDYLTSLKLPPERLFLGAAKAVSPAAQWAPHAELILTTE